MIIMTVSGARVDEMSTLAASALTLDASTMTAEGLFVAPSCITGALNPATEVLVTRCLSQLGIRWGMGGTGRSQVSCCTGILYHGDVATLETSLLVIARLWSIAAELGFGTLATVCVTSYAMHREALELCATEPGLEENVDRWLHKACGRRLVLPQRLVHASEVFWMQRSELAGSFRYRLVDRQTGAPLRVVEHVGCHYSQLFPEHAIGGIDYCDVLAGMVRQWGGAVIDYPMRRACCGMGFRQCMIRPNRGYTLANVRAKLESMAPYTPDLIVTNCPGCHEFLDREQYAVERISGQRFDYPTLSYAELAALLLGWDPYSEVGIQSHTVPVEPLLEKIGIPFDRRREFSADRGQRLVRPSATEGNRGAP